MANQSERCNKFVQLDRSRLREALAATGLFERRSGVISAIVELIIEEKEHSFSCGWEKAIDQDYVKMSIPEENCLIIDEDEENNG